MIVPRGRLQMAPFALAAVVAAWCLCFVRAQDIEDSFCATSGQTLTLVDDNLYINGGWWLWSSAKGYGDYSGPADYMRTINLKKEFKITSDISTYAPVSLLPKNVPRLDNAAIWPIEPNSFDMMLGAQRVSQEAIYAKEMPDSYHMSDRWRYNTKTGEWTKESDTILDGWSPKRMKNMISSRAAIWVPRRKMGVFIGGTIYNNNVYVDMDRTPSDSMLVYEQETKTWTNESVPHSRMENTQAVQLAAGDDDLIIALGVPRLADDEQHEFRMLNMRTIHIYSFNKRKWYKHVLGSDVIAPSRRAAYCLTIVSSPDRTSHQIILMGGISTNENIANLDGATTDTSVWVLNIPSMQWVQLPGNTASEAPRGIIPGGRVSPSCTAVGHGYILLSGGRRVNEPFEKPTCDNAGNNIFLFNANTGQWVEKYNTSQRYKIPDIITSAATTASLPLTDQPKDGYTDSALKNILVFPSQKPDPTDDTSKPGSSNASDSSDSSSGKGKSNKNTIAIAVGTSVGIVGGIIILFVILWELRRRRRASSDSGPPHIPLAQNLPELYNQYPYSPTYPFAQNPPPNNPAAVPYDAWPKEEQERWNNGAYSGPGVNQPYEIGHGMYDRVNELSSAPSEAAGGAGRRNELPGSQIDYVEIPGVGVEPVEVDGRKPG